MGDKEKIELEQESEQVTEEVVEEHVEEQAVCEENKERESDDAVSENVELEDPASEDVELEETELDETESEETESEEAELEETESVGHETEEAGPEETESDDEAEDIESDDEALEDYEESDAEIELITEDEFEDRTEEETSTDGEADSEETGENESLIEAEKAWEKSKKRKKVRNIVLVIVLLIVAIYCGAAFFFQNHFLPFTKINGTDFSMKTVQQVEDYLRKQVEDYSLTLLESDGDEEVIRGTDLELQYVPGDDVAKLMKSQETWLWVKAFWAHPDIEASVGVEYDHAKFSSVMKNLKCMKDEPIISIDAHPEFKDTQFEVVAEQVGTEIDEDIFTKAVAKAIEEFRSELDMLEEGCYILPKFLKDSPEVIEATEEMNSYLGANITLDFNPYTEVVDASQIAQWVVVDENMNVSFDQELVRAYVASLAEKYDTYGKTRSFVSGYGDTVEVQGGSYGWLIDQEAEYAALTANIQNAETVTREPNYSRRGASHEGNDFGNTYIEIDLTRQHVFFFQNGQCTLQSDVVTGNPNLGNGTPQGVYSIAYKQQDQVLRGPKQPDGTYEWESPVKYWMPFNGGIGLHDAPWRSSFGGTIYNGNGSHGCVNLPPEFAAQLYPLVEAGMPVVCHY